MLRFVVVLLAVLCTPALAIAQTGAEERPVNRELQVSEVPEKAMLGARKAAPGVYFVSAETGWWKDEFIYRLKGTKFQEEWFVYVNIQGTVLHTSNDLRDR